jgi:hypothetical protein
MSGAFAGSSQVEDPRQGIRQSSVQDDMKRRVDLMNQFFPQDTTASDRFNSLIDSPPQMNNPGFGRRLTAGLAGIGQYNKQTGMWSGGGPDVTEKILYEPYLRELSQWKEQLTPAQQAAVLENQSNNINRQAGSTMVNAEVAADRVRQQEEAARIRQQGIDQKNDETNRHNMENERIAQRRNEIMNMKRTDPTWHFEDSGDGTIYAFNEKDPNQRINTGIKSTNLDDYQKAVLGIAGQAYVQGMRNDGQIQTKQTVPGKNPGDETGKQFTDRQQMAWKQIYDSGAPEKKWLVRGADGVFDIADKPQVGGGKTLGMFGSAYTPADVAEWQRVYDAGYPKQGLQSGDLQVNTVTSKGNMGSFKVGDKVGNDINSGNIPTRAVGAARADGWIYNRNPGNQSEIVKTNARTGETQYSHDGGKTWGAR